ncbi:MAG: pantetheine-phosphate adenylyltransferase [Hyphomicrobiales bacterium]|nr:pantetheine-phosphate adenylyltransferase [Hyphomicrobiales bacterium]MCP5373055.1 pantetheine-phosphate adenylyltransferase [Hyphomicrobiales bacterium]
MDSVKVGVYPGTFDPVTKGHMDIIERAMQIVDKLIVGVAVNAGKGPLFTLEDRVRLLRDEVAEVSLHDGQGIEVRPFDTLLMHFVQSCDATIIIRGLRAVSDFEYEFQMAGMNRRLDPGVETVFMMASDKYQLIASRLVKEIGILGGDVSHFVSPRVTQELIARFAELHAAGGVGE